MIRLYQQKKIVLIVLFCLLSLVASFAFSRLYAFTPTPRVENEKTSMKTIPKEVQKTLIPASSSASFRIPILMYHYVEYVQDRNDKTRQSLNIPPNIFTQQVQTLHNAGYTFLTASDIGQVLDGSEQLPAKPILLTFDDGHLDFFTDVLPILEQYKVKATNYVITDFLGGSDFMTRDDVVAISNSGLVEVGAHTEHHLALKGLSLSQVQNEVSGSKKALEALIHKPVVSFAYPYGSFDLQAMQVVKDAGFTTAVSTIPGIDVTQQNRYFLFRLRPGYRVGQELLTWLSGSTFQPW